jgi:hypothetical protein
MNRAMAEAISGGIGGAVALAIMYPLVVVKVRLQAMKKAQRGCDGADTEYPGPKAIVVEALQRGGLLELYSGLLTAMFRAFYDNYVFYFAFSSLRRMFVKGRKPGKVGSALHGLCSGVVVQLVGIPLDTILTRVINGKGHFFQVVSDIYHDGGLRAFWSSLGPGLMLTVNPAVNTLVRNALTPEGERRASRHFVVGLVSKGCASFITYPYVMAKVARQVGGAGTIYGWFRQKIALEGIPGLYRGCTLQIGNAMLKEAINNAVRLEIVRFVSKLLLGSNITT